MEERPVKQAFGSPGGKSYLAPRIVTMIPQHDVYVEPFAGGAAVYFRKAPSKKEILNDADSGIAFAFRFLRDMTPSQYEDLLRQNWVISKKQFDRLVSLKPKSDVGRFYKFFYIKRASYGCGGKSYNWGNDGRRISMDHLWRAHERLKNTWVGEGNALRLIRRHDSPNTFFYLDPPYPNRAFIGRSFKDWTEKDLAELVKALKGIKGRFMISLGTEHAKLLPKNWCIRRLKVMRFLTMDEYGGRSAQYEIVATNYDADAVIKGRALSRRITKTRTPKRPPPEKLLYR